MLNIKTGGINMFCNYTDKNGKPYTLSYKCYTKKDEEHCPMEKQCIKDVYDICGIFSEDGIKVKENNSKRCKVISNPRYDFKHDYNK